MEERTVIIDGRSTLRNGHRHMVNIVVLLLIFIAGCEREVVPQYLMGVWKTSAPSYADRFLKISEYSITYGVGDGEEVSHMIDKIKKQQEGGKTVYIFYYRDAEGEKDNLTVTYSPDSGGTLQIKNIEQVWQKADLGQAGR